HCVTGVQTCALRISQQRPLQAGDGSLTARGACAVAELLEHAPHPLHAFAVTGAAHLPGARPLARKRVRGARHHADRKPSRESEALPVLRERAEHPAPRPEDLEDLERVADVEAELAALPEAGGRA